MRKISLPRGNPKEKREWGKNTEKNFDVVAIVAVGTIVVSLAE